LNHLTKETEDLINKIARHQGSIFIKELLRKKRKVIKQVKICINKEEIISNLISALDNDFISSNDLIEWIREVEGWGKQHVYLYLTPFINNNKITNDRKDEIIKRLQNKKLEKFLNSITVNFISAIYCSIFCSINCSIS
jgi:hypothetical protein